MDGNLYDGFFLYDCEGTIDRQEYYSMQDDYSALLKIQVRLVTRISVKSIPVTNTIGYTGPK